jgi:hypothetical protein
MCLLWSTNCGFITQRTAFFIVTAVKNSNLTSCAMSPLLTSLPNLLSLVPVYKVSIPRFSSFLTYILRWELRIEKCCFILDGMQMIAMMTGRRNRVANINTESWRSLQVSAHGGQEGKMTIPPNSKLRTEEMSEVSTIKIVLEFLLSNLGQKGQYSHITIRFPQYFLVKTDLHANFGSLKTTYTFWPVFTKKKRDPCGETESCNTTSDFLSLFK